MIFVQALAVLGIFLFSSAHALNETQKQALIVSAHLQRGMRLFSFFAFFVWPRALTHANALGIEHMLLQLHVQLHVGIHGLRQLRRVQHWSFVQHDDR
jgi:hypothetical protein